MFCAKNRFKKHQIFEKWEHFQNRPSCKGYSLCKIFALDQKLKFQKTSQNLFYKSFTVVLWKNRSKKHQIFEKSKHFQNRPSCKGYSPCKILTFGQKLKFQKTSQNPFYKSLTVILCKKLLQKTPNIRDMKALLKLAIIQSPHFGSKIKIPKNIPKSILKIIYSVSVQKTASKNTKYSRNESIFKIGHHAKAIAHAKSSPWVKN